MGNQKFRLTDMIPNAWFYKLKDMNKPSKNTQSLSSSMLIKKHHLPPPPAPPSSPPISTMKTTPPQPELECLSRKSYHIARELTSDLPRDLDSLILLKSPPRKSKSSTKSRRSTRRSSSISSCSCQSTSTSLSCRSKSTRSPPSPLAIPETEVVVKTVDYNNVGYIVQDALLGDNKHHKQSIISEQSIPDRNRNALVAPEHFDIVIDVDKESLRTTNNNKINKFDFQLPPIITTKQETTKPTNKNFSKKLQPPTLLKEQRNNNSPPSRRLSVSSPAGVRLKVNSPRIIGRKQGQNGNKIGGRRSTSSKKRRSISESFAVVKSSFDPQRDFKESMVEMILQNNLTAAKDLEDLLACYLSLNSDEYHQVIIKVFKQIWFDLRTRKNPT